MRPRMMRFIPGCRSPSLPSRMASPIVDTRASSVGSIPRTTAPPIAGGWLSIASVSRKGAAPTEPGGSLELLNARPPVGDRPPVRAQGRMRREAEEAGAQLGFEAVHDRNHGDQGQNAQGDAKQRHPGDEGDEKTVLACQRISQAHENWKGLKHARRLNHRPPGSGCESRGGPPQAPAKKQHNQSVKSVNYCQVARVVYCPSAVASYGQQSR